MNTSKEAVEMHLRAISEREVEAYRQTMNFPFTYQNYNGVALTIEKAAEWFFITAYQSRPVRRDKLGGDVLLTHLLA